MQGGGGPIGLSHLGEPRTDTDTDTQEIVSCILEIRDTNTLQTQIQRIVEHLVIPGITKRMRLFTLLQRDLKVQVPTKILKKVIERVLVHTWSSAQDLPLPSYHGTLVRPRRQEVLLTQREIENEIHLSLFQGINPWLRNVVLYDIPTTIPLRNRFLHEEDDTVSFQTQYPRSLQRLFGTVKLLSHLNRDESEGFTTDASIVASALGSALHEPYLQGKRLLSYLKDDAQGEEDEGSLLESLNEWAPDRSGTPSYAKVSEYLEALDPSPESPRYSFTVRDLQILSESLRAGFALYTNRYTQDETTFELYLAIDTDDGPILCLYQDGSDPLQQIVFRGDPTYIPSLQTLRKQKGFEEIYQRWVQGPIHV